MLLLCFDGIKPIYSNLLLLVRLTTGWTVRDRIPVGTRFSARLHRPWGPPSLL